MCFPFFCGDFWDRFIGVASDGYDPGAIMQSSMEAISTLGPGGGVGDLLDMR